MIFTVFAICITVSEAAMGLAIVILLFRIRRYGDGRPPRPAERMMDNGLLTLASLLLPAASFLVLAWWRRCAARAVTPVLVDAGCALSLAAAVAAWVTGGPATTRSGMASGAGRPLATVECSSTGRRA
jgi:hypothetical protein